MSCSGLKNRKQIKYINMSTTINHPISITHESTRSLRSPVIKFLNWSADQQENRLAWQGIGLLVFGCFLTPLSVLLISLTGANLFFTLTALVAMEVTLVLDLTAMPTKITIPAFFLGVVADITIIVVSAISAI
jgi:hypothetical protein